MACTYTYEGKDYTKEELSALLHESKELLQLPKETKVEPKVGEKTNEVTIGNKTYIKNENGVWVNQSTGNEVKGIGSTGKDLIKRLENQSIVPKKYKLTEKGQAFEVRNIDGKLEVTNSKGDAVSKTTKRAVLRKHAEQFDFTKGEKANFEGFTEFDYPYINKHIEDTSQNSFEVASAILTDIEKNNAERLDAVEQAIANSIGKVNVNSFKEYYSGKDDLKHASKYLSKDKGEDLDAIAQNAETEYYGDYNANEPRIIEEDVYKFMMKYPKGIEEYNKQERNSKLSGLKNKFTELTGLPANEEFLLKAIEQGNRKNELNSTLENMSDEELNNYYNELKQSEEEFYGKNEQVTEGTPKIENPIVTKEEPTEGEKSLKVGINNQSLTRVANELGLEAPTPGEGWSSEEATKTGRELIKAGAEIEPIVEKVKNKEILTPEELSVARAYFEDNLIKKVNEAESKGRDSQEYKDAKAEADKFNKEVIAPSKEAWAKTGAAFQGETDVYDGSFYKLESAFKEKLKTDDLTKEQENLVSKLAKDINDAKSNLKDINEAISKAHDELAKLYEQKNKGGNNKDDIASKARQLAKDIRLGKKLALPDWAVAEGAKDVHAQGGSYQEILAKALEVFADVHDATKDFAQAVEKGFEKLKEWYKDNGIKLDEEDIKSKFSQYADSQLNNSKNATDEIDRKINERIKSLQKQIDDVVSGKVKPTKESEVWSKEISELKATLADVKYQDRLIKLTESLKNRKDNKFTPSQSKAIWDYVKETYLDKGEEYPDAIRKASSDLNLEPKELNEAISLPKSFKVTTREMYERQKRLRQAQMIAKEMVKKANTSKLKSTINDIPNVLREIKVAGHGGVGFMTHVMNSIYRVNEYKQTSKMFFDQYRYMFKPIEYEKDKVNLLADPDYHFWRTMGADIDPTEHNTGYEVGKLRKLAGETGERAFFALKNLRLAQLKNVWNSLPEDVKSDPNTARLLAQEFNYSSGSSKYKTKEGRITTRGNFGPMEGFFNNALFAKNLMIAKYQHTIINPARAVETLLSKKSTIGEREVAKITLKRQMTGLLFHSIALALNAATLKALGSSSTPNVTDPTKPDFLCMKLADGSYVPLSKSNDQSYKLLLTLGKYGVQTVKGESHKGSALGSLESQARNMLSPIAGTAVDFANAKDAVGNPLSFLSWNKGTKRGMGVVEYLLRDQTPIPIGEAASHIYKEKYDEGRADDLKIAGEALAHGLLAGGFGTNKMKMNNQSESTPLTKEERIKERNKQREELTKRRRETHKGAN